MKKMFLLSALATIAVLSAADGFAIDSTATGNAKVIIVDPVTVTHSGDALDFGEATASESHVITIEETDGSVSSTVSGQLITSPNDGRDEFVVTGPQGVGVNVSLPDGLAINDKLNITSFRADCGNSFTMPDAGSKTVKVGGTLAVTAGATSGTYDENSYTLTVSY